MSSRKRASNGLPHSSRSKRRKSSDTSADELDTEPVSPTPPQPAKTRKANASQHIRFGKDATALDRAPIHPSQPENHTFGDEDELNDSNADADNLEEASDDSDAPESISAAAAEQHVKASRASASKAVAEQRSRQKTLRKKRDAQLKAQARPLAASTSPAAAARQDPKPNKGAEVDVIQDGSDMDGEASSQSHDAEDATAPSPELLPAHVLADEDALVVRATPSPSPPPQKRLQQSKAMGKHILLHGGPSPQPRDRRAGPVNVRVLEKSSPYLPPKAVGKTKALRETWLRGRKGPRKGRGWSVGVERREVNQGFVRA